VNDSPTAFLYDIHGNLVALEAVLADAEAAGVTSYLLGGDYSSMGPWPRETAELLEGLPARVPESVQEFLATGLTAAREALGPELVDRFYALPEQAELDGILVCHGSPLSDIESFAPEAQVGEERLLVGESDRTILFGHSHQQFRRPGPNGTLLVNPGSVGAPLDGDTRAAWALYQDGDIAFRRTAYDVERAAAKMRSHGEWAEPIVYRIEHGRDAGSESP